MRIVQISPEAVPYAKTGGLADVVGALSAYLSRCGHSVTLFLPLYRMIREAGFEPGPVELELGPAELGLPAEAAIRSIPSTGGPSVRVVDAPGLFDRDGLYGIAGSDHPDNLLRFAVFCRAALCAIEESPDILHVHDWQSSLAAVLLQSGPPPGATAISGASADVSSDAAQPGLPGPIRRRILAGHRVAGRMVPARPPRVLRWNQPA